MLATSSYSVANLWEKKLKKMHLPKILCIINFIFNFLIFLIIKIRLDSICLALVHPNPSPLVGREMLMFLIVFYCIYAARVHG